MPSGVSHSVSSTSVPSRYCRRVARVPLDQPAAGAIRHEPLPSSPRSAAKQAPESNRGTHIQSIAPSSPISAAVWVSPTSAYCSIRDAMSVCYPDSSEGDPPAGPASAASASDLGIEGGEGVGELHERHAQLRDRIAQHVVVGRQAVPEGVDHGREGVDGQRGLVHPGAGGRAVGHRVRREVQDRELPQAHGVVGHDVGHRHRGQLRPGLADRRQLLRRGLSGRVPGQVGRVAGVAEHGLAGVAFGLVFA